MVAYLAAHNITCDKKDAEGAVTYVHANIQKPYYSVL